MGWLTIVGARAGKREGYHFKRLILTHLSERVAIEDIRTYSALGLIGWLGVSLAERLET